MKNNPSCLQIGEITVGA